jgi:CRP/FNR family transcriptional regulator, cyclic AMP receptor protein
MNIMKNPGTSTPLGQIAESTWSDAAATSGGQVIEKTHSRYNLIAASPFFNGLKPTHLQLLADAAMPVHFDPGQLILQKSDPANRFYLILRGRVELESLDRNGIVHRIETLGPNSVLGWSWLFAPFYWNFDAVAQEPTDALFFYGTRLRLECDKDHDFGYEIVTRMSRVVIDRLQTTCQNWIEGNHQTLKR